LSLLRPGPEGRIINDFSLIYYSDVDKTFKYTNGAPEGGAQEDVFHADGNVWTRQFEIHRRSGRVADAREIYSFASPGKQLARLEVSTDKGAHCSLSTRFSLPEVVDQIQLMGSTAILAHPAVRRGSSRVVGQMLLRGFREPECETADRNQKIMPLAPVRPRRVCAMIGHAEPLPTPGPQSLAHHHMGRVRRLLSAHRSLRATNQLHAPMHGMPYPGRLRRAGQSALAQVHVRPFRGLSRRTALHRAGARRIAIEAVGCRARTTAELDD
jgi:hypothetical protein